MFNLWWKDKKAESKFGGDSSLGIQNPQVNQKSRRTSKAREHDLFINVRWVIVKVPSYHWKFLFLSFAQQNADRKCTLSSPFSIAVPVI